jgi:hypothetical protein
VLSRPQVATTATTSRVSGPARSATTRLRCSRRCARLLLVSQTAASVHALPEVVLGVNHGALAALRV